MSYSVDVMDLPKEILIEIFSNLDVSNLDVVAKVCGKWSVITQMIHDKAWKSVSRAVQLKSDIIGPLFEKRGWIEAEHGMDQCKCIKMSIDLLIYDDLQILNSDLELFKLYEAESSFYEFLRSLRQEGDRFYEIDEIEYPELTEIQAFSRLSAAGVLNNIRNAIIGDDKLLSEVLSIKHVGQFLSNIKESLEILEGLDYPQEYDLTNLFRWINCKEFTLAWHENAFSNAEIESLTEVLNRRVEKFSYKFGCEPFLPYIEQYDGRGKCHEIELVYAVVPKYFDNNDEDFTYLWDRRKLMDWAETRGWTFTVDTVCEWPDDSNRINLKRN